MQAKIFILPIKHRFSQLILNTFHTILTLLPSITNHQLKSQDEVHCRNRRCPGGNQHRLVLQGPAYAIPIPTLYSCATSKLTIPQQLAWGKRDYACVNVYQGIPDNSTVTAGQTVRVRFNRKPTGRCPDPLTQYPGDAYSVWLYNNPVRNLDTISFDQSIKIAGGINETAGVVDVTIPKNLPAVQDGSLWYLRIGTSLSTAPQVCFLLFSFFFFLLFFFLWV